MSNALKRSILEYALDHWRREGAGVSALEISSALTVPHEDVLSIFDEFERNNVGTLNRDVTLYTGHLGESSDYSTAISTAIFFPSRKVLDWDFKNKELDRIGTPEYRARMQRGFSQIQQFYFGYEVLRKYLDHPETYMIEDKIDQGYIMPSRDHLDVSDAAHQQVFPLFRFGKRTLKNGETVVAAILADLVQLPEQDQHHWQSYEVTAPEFQEDDPEYDSYYQQNFEGEFSDLTDPLQEVIDEIDTINQVSSLPLYTSTVNPHLSYPVVNTRKAYCDACSELYKIIGPDSLSEEELKRLLRNLLHLSEEDFIHPDGNRPRGKVDLFSELCKGLGITKLGEAFSDVKEHRIEADHRITKTLPNDDNYTRRFRDVVSKLADGLRSLRLRVAAQSGKDDDT